MRFHRQIWILVACFLATGCKPSTEPTAVSPVTTEPTIETPWTQERDALKQQIAALDAEADRVTRELVRVKVERDQLKRELKEMAKRGGCTP